MNGPTAISNRTKSRLNLAPLRRVVEKFLASRRLTAKTVSVAIVGDQLMRRLNRQTRGQDKVTDVLSFRDSDAAIKDKNFLGEIIINYQQIKRQAKRFRTSVREELIFILVHGLLHLTGLDDKTEKQAKRMEALGKKFIAKYGKF